MDGKNVELVATLSEFLSQSWWSGAGVLVAILLPVFGMVWALRRHLVERAKQRRRDEGLSKLTPERLEERRKVVGRDSAVADLRDLLTTAGAGAITPVAHGIGGAGKTTLARHYARVHAGDYARRRILRAETEQTLVADLAFLGREMDQGLTALSDAAAARVTLRMIEERTSREAWLLIYDNAETPAALEPWKAQGAQCHVLVTSRFPDWTGAGYEPLKLPKLSRPAAVEILRNESGRDDPGFPALAGQLDDLPLALVQAGEWLRANPKVSADGYGADIAKLRKRTPPPGMTSEADRTTAAVVEKTLGLLTRDARAVLDVLAWWAPEGLRPELFEAPGRVPWSLLWRGGVPRRLRRVIREPARVHAAFDELRLRALLEDGDGESGGLRLHRVFALVVRSQVALEGKEGFRQARAAAALLGAVYPGGQRSPQNPDTWDDRDGAPGCRTLMPQGLALWEKAEGLWDKDWGQPGWPAMDTLLNQIGIFLRSQEDRAGALAAYRGSHGLTTAHYKETDRAFAVALGNLAMGLMQASEFAEAEELLDRALALTARDRAGGADHADSLRQRANLEFGRWEAGTAADKQGDLAAALGWLEQALEIETSLADGAASEDLARTWNDIGYLHRLAGRSVESADAAESAYETLAELPDVNRVALATSAMNAGVVRLEAGQPEAAEGLLREAWEILQVIYAQTPGHSGRGNAADWLATCLLVLDRKEGGTARQGEARGIVTAVGLDWETVVAQAARYPLDPVAPGDGEG